MVVFQSLLGWIEKNLETSAWITYALTKFRTGHLTNTLIIHSCYMNVIALSPHPVT